LVSSYPVAVRRHVIRRFDHSDHPGSCGCFGGFIYIDTPGLCRKEERPSKLPVRQNKRLPSYAQAPEIVIPEVVNAEYRTIDPEDASRRQTKALPSARTLPWRLALRKLRLRLNLKDPRIFLLKTRPVSKS